MSHTAHSIAIIGMAGRFPVVNLSAFTSPKLKC